MRSWPGTTTAAAKLQLQFALFPAKLQAKGLAPVMKAAMEIIGRPMGEPYPPFPALNATEKDALAAELERRACSIDHGTR